MNKMKKKKLSLETEEGEAVFLAQSLSSIHASVLESLKSGRYSVDYYDSKNVAELIRNEKFFSGPLYKAIEGYAKGVALAKFPDQNLTRNDYLDLAYNYVTLAQDALKISKSIIWGLGEERESSLSRKYLDIINDTCELSEEIIGLE